MQSVGEDSSAAAFRKRRRTSPSPQHPRIDLGAPPPRLSAPLAAPLPQIRAYALGDPPPLTQLKHPASVMHGRGKRTARMPSPSQSSWMRTAMVPIQPSPATMAKVEKAHEFLQRRWNARQQQAELHLQKERTALKRKVMLANNVRNSHTQPPTSSLV